MYCTQALVDMLGQGRRRALHCSVLTTSPPPNDQILCLSKLHEHLTSTATVCTGRDKGMCTGGGGGGGGSLHICI